MGIIQRYTNAWIRENCGIPMYGVLFSNENKQNFRHTITWKSENNYTVGKNLNKRVYTVWLQICKWQKMISSGLGTSGGRSVRPEVGCGSMKRHLGITHKFIVLIIWVTLMCDGFTILQMSKLWNCTLLKGSVYCMPFIPHLRGKRKGEEENRQIRAKEKSGHSRCFQVPRT